MDGCLVCANDDPAKFRIYYDGPQKLFRCLDCGMVAQYRGPGSETRVLDYSEFYEQELGWEGDWQYPERAAALPDIAARIRAAGGSGKLLDVGCGDGQFLAACRSRGFDVCGVEESTGLAAYARERTGAPIIVGRYAPDQFEPGTFDVVSFIQVVEHVPDPRGILSIARTHLRPGGILCIEVPSRTAPHFLAYQATRARRFIDYPRGVLPTHIAYYHPAAMRRLTADAGFGQISLTTGRWAAKYHGWKHAIGRTIDPVANRLGVGGILYLGTRH